MMKEIYDYMFPKHMVSLCVVQVHFWSGTRLVPSSLLISTSWFLILAAAFRNGQIVAGSTARRNAAEKNETSGHTTVPCLAKMLQHSSTADWIKF